ncbi:hypothetical protein Vau01_007480 [Virgisporangium aurantiacum]|uniref:HTH cro/C1-type domain-containing protein n=2 Tax=Virgisporangium aurantiacum TaxID=175570 RepID=A0A8J4DYN6_9ACTN|nr:hypothetical protein Vau01_007480 [Virgisporangium aurantiacum]
MSAAELARRIDMTTQTVSNWERGRQRPTEDALNVVADVLNVPKSFLSRTHIEAVGEERVSFRARTRIQAAARDAALAAATLSIELNTFIEEKFHLPRTNVPTLERPRPEMAAEYVRAK